MAVFSIDKTRCIDCGRCVRACPMGIFRRTEAGVEVGREKRCIRCMHCAAACPARAIRCEGLSEEALYPPAPAQALERLVKLRRSVRHYRDELPKRELIEKALADAAWAPTAKNTRPYGWLVLWGKAQTDRAAALVVEHARASREAPELVAMDRSGLNCITCGAPCVLLCYARDDAPNPVLDAAIVTATVELLLNQEGLSTCWGGYLSWFANIAPQLRAWLEVPEGCHVITALMAGYADGERYDAPPYRPAPAIRWLDGAPPTVS